MPTDKTNLNDFQNLWQSIYGTWEQNLFVWAVVFRRVEG